MKIRPKDDVMAQKNTAAVVCAMLVKNSKKCLTSVIVNKSIELIIFSNNRKISSRSTDMIPTANIEENPYIGRCVVRPVLTIKL